MTTQNETIAYLAERLGRSRDDVRRAYLDLMEMLARDLLAGRIVVLPELGRLRLAPKAARTGIRNPHTGEKMPDRPPGWRAKFTAAPGIRRQLADGALPRTAE